MEESTKKVLELLADQHTFPALVNWVEPAALRALFRLWGMYHGLHPPVAIAASELLDLRDLVCPVQSSVNEVEGMVRPEDRGGDPCTR